MAAAPDLDAVARLARLAIPEDARATLAGELDRLWAWIQTLPEPAASPEPDEGAPRPLRRDAPVASLSQEEALREAPVVAEGHFQVPPGGTGG